MSGGIPKHWDKMWEGPEMPLAWLRSVIMRKIALKSWIEAASKAFNINYVGTQNIVNLALENKVNWFFFASTSHVYKSSKKNK